MISKPGRPAFGVLELIALAVVLHAGWLALAHAGQAPLDVHAFRQSQTALTAYWFVHEGFKWAYETPVAGAPWAIPFEFPLYQLIVAMLSRWLELPLEVVGRVLSHVFLLSCILPARSITRRLDLPDRVLPVFVAIAFSMPLHVYWGRSFMIETTALFFTLAALGQGLELAFGRLTPVTGLLFTVFATLALLQKATTALPVLIVLALLCLLAGLRRKGKVRALLGDRAMWVTGLLFLIPVMAGYAWLAFTDQVKSLNPLGVQLTSAALVKWNWGALAQRLSADLWVQVVWQRMFVTNLGGLAGLILLLVPLLFRTGSRAGRVVAVTWVLGLFPLLLFSNLHIVHDYYQTANLVFMAYGLAVALVGVMAPVLGNRAMLMLVVLMVFSNLAALKSGYLPQIRQVFAKDNRDVAVGGLLGRELPVGMQFVTFGNDWSSTFAYVSGRKSFMVPGWFRDHDRIVARPEDFVQPGRLGGVVSCASAQPDTARLLAWSAAGRNWRVGETHGCLIALPETPLPETPLPAPQREACLGSIDRFELDQRNGHRVLVLAGWSAKAGQPALAPDDVHLVLTPAGGVPRYLQALRVPRPDVNRPLGIADEQDAGFSRLLAADLPAGEYEARLILRAGGEYLSCGFSRKIMLKPPPEGMEK